MSACATGRLVWRGIAALLLGWAALTARVTAAQDLQRDLDHLVSSASLGTGVVGYSVLDLRTGRPLAERNASTALVPASNMKLLTSGAALFVLGTEFKFKTTLSVAGDRLIITGSGDPALADPELLDALEPKRTVNEVLDVLAGAVPKAGVKRVREIVLDDRVFDRISVHPSWPERHLDKRYCAEVSGLNFHANILAVFPTPGARAGARPTVLVQPEARWLDVDTSKARTVNTGQNSVWLARTRGEGVFQLMGDVRSSTPEPVRVTISNPARFFGLLLADRLERKGVALGPEGKSAVDVRNAATLPVRLIGANEDIPDGRVVALVTTPIADVLRRCNTDSYNLYAESLLKRIGHEITKDPGSWDSGGSVVRMLLSEKLSPEDAASTNIADGSGMSRLNRVTPATLTRWLALLHSRTELRTTFLESLARPGTGTLRSRFAGAPLATQLRAKSGFIDGVRCLSGYLSTDQGSVIAFSILINDVSGANGPGNALNLTEAFVRRLDAHLAGIREGSGTQGG